MSVCYGVLLFALRQQVSTVVAIVTEATVAVGAMPSLLPFPLLPLAALLAVYRFGSDPNPNPNPEPNPKPSPNPNPNPSPNAVYSYAATIGAYLLTAAPTGADVASLEGSIEQA